MTSPATPVDDEAARVRGYLISQANKLSLTDLVTKVRTDSAALEAAGAAVPAARFNDRPGEGEWSAAEVWTHVLQMSENGAASITGIIESGAKPAPARDVISGETRSALTNSEAYWQTYIAVREKLYARVLEAKGDEHLDVKISHMTFGDFSWREWLLFMRVHDLDHMRQLQALALAQAFAG